MQLNSKIQQQALRLLRKGSKGAEFKKKKKRKEKLSGKSVEYTKNMSTQLCF